MEVVEDIVIVGAGIAGLTTCLGLHRLGIRSLILESSDSLRTTGFAFTTWTNAWKAMDAVGVGDLLRQQHELLQGILASSASSGLPTSELSFKARGSEGIPEVRCVKRKLLLETLERALPHGTVRYSSKVVSIEDSGHFKLVSLSDGTVIKTKVLIGCDGVNSVVGKVLGFNKPASAGRSAIRGFADFKGNHGFECKFFQYNGKGIRYGFLPCDDHTVYWFFTYSSSPQKGVDKELENDPVKMKQFVLSKLDGVPEKVKEIVEITELERLVCSPLKFRHPWEMLRANISKGNACVAGDALHPMTPDIGQGGCAALEDGVVLARCLAEALTKKPKDERDEKAEFKRIELGLKKFAKERRLRSFELISRAYIVGFVQQRDGKVASFLRDKILARCLTAMLLKSADFDCGKLNAS